MKKYIIFFFLGGLLASCQDEYLNPSAASETQVINDVNGLITIANGLQYKYTITRVSPMYTLPTLSGLLSKEQTVLNAGNTDEELLRIGGNSVTPSNAVANNLWSQSNIIKANAEIIYANLDKVPDLGTRSGLQAYAAIFKALALGNLAMFWQQAPLTVEKNATFSPRAEVLQAAIKILAEAGTAITVNPPSAYFTSRIVTGIELKSTLAALIARYNLMLGKYDEALVATSGVDLTKKSGFSFDDITRNPLFDVTFSNRNVTEPVNKDLGLPTDIKPDVADARIPFYINSTTGQNLARAGFYTSNSSQIPVYLPGEILLIQAECQARKGNMSEAVNLLNKVLTKTTDPWGVTAKLPAYSGEMTAEAVLTEIYRNRCIELFLSGMRLEDSRRLARPQVERGRNWLPYPLSERDNNTNTPKDDPTL